MGHEPTAETPIPGVSEDHSRRFARDVLGIFGTRVVWTLIAGVCGIILARWLGPHNRGLLGAALLLPATVVTLVKLGISQANVYHINREKAPIDQIASNSLFLAIVSGVAAPLLVWSMRDNVLAGVLQGMPSWALALALVIVPLQLIDNYLYGVLQATRQFGLYNSRLLISEAARLTLVVVSVIVLDLGLPAAIGTYVLVSLLNVVFLLSAMHRRMRFSPRLDLALMRSQLSFGALSYVQTVTMHLLLRIDAWMVWYLLGPAQFAFYSVALRATELVLEVPQAVGLVLYPRLASLPEDEVHRLTAQACRRTLFVTLPSAAALAFLGHYIVPLWYGTPFAPAALPLPWAAAGAVMMSMFVILTRNFTARGKQRVNIIAGLLALASNVALNIHLIPAYGTVGAALATAASYSAACAVLVLFFAIDSGISPTRALVVTREDLLFFWSFPSRARRRHRRPEPTTASRDGRCPEAPVTD